MSIGEYNGMVGLMNILRETMAEEGGYGPAPQNMKTTEEPQLDSEALGVEDYSEEDLNDPKKKAPTSKSKKDPRYTVKEVPDKDVQNPPTQKTKEAVDVETCPTCKGPMGRTKEGVLYCPKCGRLEREKDFPQVFRRNTKESKSFEYKAVGNARKGDSVFSVETTFSCSHDLLKDRKAVEAKAEGALKSKAEADSIVLRSVKPVQEVRAQFPSNLYLCENCYKTFRANDGICPHCFSNIVEKVIQEEEEYYHDVPNESKVNENYSADEIANAVVAGLQKLGYWHTETLEQAGGTQFEFISTDGPKVRLFVESVDVGAEEYQR